MDDVDELDLDDDFFSPAQPLAGFPWNLNSTTKTSSAGGPSIAPAKLQDTPSAAVSKGSNASHRAPLKPLATLLQVPDFPRSARALTPPTHPPYSGAAQRTEASPAVAQSGAHRVTKRPAEGHSLFSSKRIEIDRRQNTAASIRSQPTSSTPTISSQSGLVQSGFRQPSATEHQGPWHDRQRHVQQHSRAVTPFQPAGPSQPNPHSSAVSVDQSAASMKTLIPGPAGKLQQQMDSTLPPTPTTRTHGVNQHCFSSSQDDFATEAWKSAIGTANAHSSAGELSYNSCVVPPDAVHQA